MNIAFKLLRCSYDINIFILRRPHMWIKIQQQQHQRYKWGSHCRINHLEESATMVTAENSLNLPEITVNFVDEEIFLRKIIIFQTHSGRKMVITLISSLTSFLIFNNSGDVFADILRWWSNVTIWKNTFKPTGKNEQNQTELEKSGIFVVTTATIVFAYKFTNCMCIYGWRNFCWNPLTRSFFTCSLSLYVSLLYRCTRGVSKLNIKFPSITRNLLEFFPFYDIYSLTLFFLSLNYRLCIFFCCFYFSLYSKS